jgi:hypothetical protein
VASLASQFAKEPPAGPGGIHEIKRWVPHHRGPFAQIAAAIAVLPVRSCIIACDANGLAVFELPRYRRREHAVALCAFDLLELEGYDTRRTPIEEHKFALAKLLGGAQDGIVFSEHYRGEGAIFYKHACALGCEGHRVETPRLAVPRRPRRGSARGHARGPIKLEQVTQCRFPPPW